MTHDDDFVTHLQAMARETPAIHVDDQQILRAGRRRRVARRSGVAALALAAVATSAAGVQAVLPDSGDGRPAPAAGDPSATATQAEDEPAGVVFDPAAGTVVSPLDAWDWTPQDYAIQYAALEHFRATCLAEAGVPGYEGVAQQVSVPVIPDDGFQVYGLWQQSQLDGLGYTPRPDPGDVAPRSAYDGTPKDGSDLDQALACIAQADEAGLVYDENLIEDQGPPIPDLTDQSQAVAEDWAQCVRADGVRTQAGEEGFPGLLPTIPEDATPEELRRIAEVDLGCKDELGSVEALAALAGQWQGEHIADAQGRLTQIRDAQAPVLAAAEVYLDAHGITVPPHDPATS
ncbi:hypothetical protein WDZ16_16160 [Pseudokineococcus marinus]|uniref:Uncharacterized protein n=1 Tax=Pseudokineococcus marinus TaxID=351215 RepID=A0A849BG86_9ACTN|nr:hypothetical protein [Pseudokineococcus marinus]NNH22100.1 hypothetical protein [Pseudokineococcus marinus]